MKSNLKRVLIILAWLAVILVLSAIPKRYDFIPAWFYHAIYPWPPFRIMFSWDDLVSALAHISMFAVLAYLATWALSGDKKSTPARMAAVFALSMLIGLGAEIFQEFIPRRGFGADDLVSDAIGALLGLYLFWRYKVLPKNLRIP